MPFPQDRPRRLRRTETLRKMTRETSLHVSDLICPMFVVNGENVKSPVESMPGVYQVSVDNLLLEGAELMELGIPAVILFGVPVYKDAMASSGFDPKEAVQRGVAALKEKCPDLAVITDVCLCAYTSDGHCGLVKEGEIANDPTLQVLSQVALSHARAGADIVAPSDMMDGRVGAIRQALDNEGFENTGILSYAVKYASAFYGPFRDAADSTPSFGDRRTHQMDPANSREAVKEVLEDLQEGADMVMVKPALSYLDVIRDVKESVFCPVAAYNVSGEYSMIKAAARQGWLDERAVVLEKLLSMKRAGADLILTYHAKEAARWLAP